MSAWTEADIKSHYDRLKRPQEEQKPAAKGRKSKPRTLSERQIEQQIYDLLTAHGWLVIRMNKFLSGNAVVVQGSNEKGIPDLQARKPAEWRDGPIKRGPNGCYLWEIVWVEVKKPGGKTSAAQKGWHMFAHINGETVIVCDSVEQAAEYFGIRLEAIA